MSCKQVHYYGYSLNEIAKRLSVQPGTIHKQLQSIYQKTSTNRQPELMRLLLNLPTNAVQSLADDGVKLLITN